MNAVAASLRERLLTPADAMALDVRGRTESAVLVALYPLDGGGLGAILTRRRHDLRRHAGEVSFPGGRREPTDDSLLHTALRETEEEIDLPAAAVHVLGALQPTPTVATSYAIYPFVGYIDAGHAFAASPREVAAVLELPLFALRAGRARRRLVRRGLPIRTDTYVVGEDLVWGATARILADLFTRLPTDA